MDILIKKKATSLVIPESINFNELVKNSNTTLSLNLQTKMVETLTNEFSEQQSRWYIANLYVYMNYHPTNDYPINLEHVFKMIGFANKGNAMKTIKSNFTKDEDYKIVIFRTEKNLNGGRPIEDIMLNVDTFKNLCMIAKTEKGKEIRKYYVKLENIYNKLIKEEIEEQKVLQENTQKLLQEKEKQLIDLQKLKVKKWYKQTPGDSVYAVKINSGLIKIGKTNKDREAHYVNNQVGDMFYIKKCFNCDLAEKVLHHILDKHRIENNKEWFEISDELTIYTIELVCDFLDKFVNVSDKLINTKLKEYINESFKLINNELIEPTIKLEPKPKPKPKVKLKANITIKPKLDDDDTETLNRFVTEFCELDNNHSTLSYELLGGYRLWARGLTLNSRKHFTKYMHQHFKSSQKYYPEYDNSKLLIYLGIRPKKLTVEQENKENLPKYEEFILTQCKYDYTYRMRYSNFVDEYQKWYIKNYPNYIFSKEEKINMEAYINRHFLKDTINMPGHRKVPGIWGLQLKSDNLHMVGINPTHRKKVVKIDINTKDILKEYPSVIIASEELNFKAQAIRGYIKSEKIINNSYLLKYKAEIEELEL